MRKEFAKLLLDYIETGTYGSKIILITADLGYGLWDNIREKYPSQFVNVGSSEQLMIGMAAGLAMEGRIPICYSITPFLLYRPFEFIRNFMNIEQLPIKLVGGGRNRDYGHLGHTHWAEEDNEIMSVFYNIYCYSPYSNKKLNNWITNFLESAYPSYLNLRK